MNEINGIPVYKIKIGDINDKLNFVSYVADPAIMKKGIAFGEKAKLFKFNHDNYKQIVAGPALIPNLPIYRFDEATQTPFYVVFEEEVIYQLVENFNRSKQEFKLNADHKTVVKSAFMLFNWIVNDPEKDLSFTKYNMLLPKGSWFIESKIDDATEWANILENEWTGYSVEGIFELALKAVHNFNSKKLEFSPVPAHESCRCEIIDGEWITDPEACEYCISRSDDFNSGKFKNKKTNTQMTKLKFAKETLEDGTVIYVSSLEVGGEVKVVDENGESVPVFDGEHLLSNGSMLVTVDGKITEVKPKVEAMAATDPVAPIVDIEENPTEDITESKGLDSKEVMDIVQPKIDEIYAVIAEIKQMIEKQPTTEVVTEMSAMSITEKLEKFKNYLS